MKNASSGHLLTVITRWPAEYTRQHGCMSQANMWKQDAGLGGWEQTRNCGSILNALSLTHVAATMHFEVEDKRSGPKQGAFLQLHGRPQSALCTYPSALLPFYVTNRQTMDESVLPQLYLYNFQVLVQYSSNTVSIASRPIAFSSKWPMFPAPIQPGP